MRTIRIDEFPLMWWSERNPWLQWKSVEMRMETSFRGSCSNNVEWWKM